MAMSAIYQHYQYVNSALKNTSRLAFRMHPVVFLYIAHLRTPQFDCGDTSVWLPLDWTVVNYSKR